MTTATLNRQDSIEWSVVCPAQPGQVVSGDLHVVVSARDRVLLAVVDGLGHGDEATQAALRAAQVMAEHPGDPLESLVQACHGALRDTRGAVMTLVAVNPRTRIATALGIGNVETVLVRADERAQPARESVLLRNGVVGYRLPTLQTCEFALRPGDVVIFATDGVREDFGDRVRAAEPLPQMVERILAQKFRGTDDALVLACKLLDDDETE